MSSLKPFHRITDRLWATAQHPRPCDFMLIAKIRDQAKTLREQDDATLVAACQQLRDRVAHHTPVTDIEIVIPCFALVVESIRRTMGLTLYDVQLLGGIVLSTGVIADIKTGEGKTLVTTLPAALYALTGKGVHIATVNRYLAERDHAQLKPVFERLGFTVGISEEKAELADKRAAYLCDITYATGYEFGFDYLRDQTRLRAQPKMRLGQRFRSGLSGHINNQQDTVQRELAMVIIDEADSVLIDEANTPLVLSGAKVEEPGMAQVFHDARKLASSLVAEDHYQLLDKKRRVYLTNEGQEVIHEAGKSPRSGLNRPWSVYVENALSAEWIHQRDVDYVVQDDKIMIVDQYTGRIFSDRSWRDGLHQAVEAKENVTVSAEAASVARISRQRYFRFYDVVCGLTGTAMGLEDEFRFFYRLPIVLVPERVLCQRQELKNRYFGTTTAKLAAIVSEIQERHKTGQPILLGTRTIEESQQISHLLRSAAVSHRVLNGMQDDSEAELIALAGEPFAVTIATNMAGRGTDIHLGPDAIQSGGLHVIATERQESLRVDRQLIGRAARQGNPGSCQFFVSAEDELLQNFGEELAEKIASSAGDGESQSDWSASVRRIQRIAEKARYESRCGLFQQDKWLNDVLTSVAEQDLTHGDRHTTAAIR